MNHHCSKLSETYLLLHIEKIQGDDQRLLIG
jgi:hypothetical protein